MTNETIDSIMKEVADLHKGKKFLTDRQEIAKAINIDRIPVITFDLTKPMDYENCYEGSKVNIEGAYKGNYSYLTSRCTAHLWGDKECEEVHKTPWLYKNVYLNCYGFGISSSFSLHDVEEMVEWSNAIRLTAESPVIVFFKTVNPFTGKKTGYLRMMKVSKHLDPHCSTVATLEDVGEE